MAGAEDRLWAEAPLLSVVMPVHNAAAYLDASVSSILAQTFSGFEFLIRDDGSTDGSHDILQKWAARDPRIRLHHGPRLGLAGAGNFLVSRARGTYVARLDADDIAYPERLSRQMEVLRAQPDLALLGATSEFIDVSGAPLRPYDLSGLLLSRRSAPFAQSSIVFPKRVFEQVGGYRPACDYWEDLDLFLRISDVGRVALLAEPLVQYRMAPTSSRLASDRSVVERALDLRCRCIDAHQRGDDYEDLLAAAAAGDRSSKLHPRTFIYLSALELWAGRPTPVLGPLLSRGDRRPIGLFVAAILWSAWATLNPATLRHAISLVVRVRNGFTRGVIRPGKLYDWRPRRRGGPEPEAVIRAAA